MLMTEALEVLEQNNPNTTNQPVVKSENVIEHNGWKEFYYRDG
jgi:hypothetical protein